MKDDHFQIASTIIMGSLKEMLAIKDFIYTSYINPQNSHLTLQGEKYVLDLIKSVLPLLISAQNSTAKENAELVMMDKLSK